MRSLLALCIMAVGFQSVAADPPARAAVAIMDVYIASSGGEFGIQVSGVATLPKPPAPGGTYCVEVKYGVMIDGVLHQFTGLSDVELWEDSGTVTWTVWATGWDLPEGVYTIDARLILGLTPSASDSTTFTVFYD